MIKQVIWSSMIDYPNHVCAILFLDVCNYDCEFCYNRELMKMKELDFDTEILPTLLNRKDFVNHVILSGGECTCDPMFTELVQKLYLNGFTIGIHTNGSNPDTVEKNMEEISFFGIDFKTSPEKYDNITRVKANTENVIKTIKLVKEHNKELQIRTTMYPRYVKKEDCLQIAKWLKDNDINQYTIQQYYQLGSATNPEQYTPDELKEIQTECNKIVHTNLKIK